MVERDKKKAFGEGEGGAEELCLWRRERGGEEVGSGSLLLLWRLHPDAAAAEGAGGRSRAGL